MGIATRSRIQRTDAFAESYAELNEQQKDAVDTIEGPVMVIAGPGTGKTQVVALRTANILKKTQMRPSNILCLTFSTSGATAMRDRLKVFLGADAYGVTVNTIHGFCNEIIAEHPLVFEEWEALEQVSDVERYRIVNRSIDSLLPNLRLVNRKNPHRSTSGILHRISQIKREDVPLERLQEVASQHEEELSHKSKEGTKTHARNLLQAQKFHEFVHIFEKYNQELKATGRYDYEDMILVCARALEQEEWLLAGLQERYQYILVDEFQDTNGAQNRIIELLTTYPTTDHDPNLCIVGDDDQAIYRFQGANVQNILSFHHRFPQAKVVILTTSYRCTQPILDAAGNLIEKNTERLVGKIEGLEKKLKAACMVCDDSPCHPQLLISPSDTLEPWLIAELVQENIDQGIAPSEIAILTQKNSELFPLYDVLHAQNIPVDLRGKLDLLKSPLVKQAMCILKAIQKPTESSLLAAALGCECFACHPADLGRLFAHRKEKHVSLHDVLLSLEGSEWQIQLINYAAVVHARNVLLDLHQKIPSRTIVETVECLLKECGLLSVIDPLTFAPLQSFFDRIKYRAYEQPNYDLNTLISDIEYYENPEYSDIRLQFKMPHIIEDGVQLMTAHQSKGLEFHTVILANMREGHWENRRTPSSLAIPEDLLFGWGKDQKKYEKNQDERRVAYVAMTRAVKELLFIVSKTQTLGDKSREVSPSQFIAEAGVQEEIERTPKNAEMASTLLLAPTRHIDQEFAAFLHERLKKFHLSVTALNHFLEDPQMFLEIDLLQMPQSKTSSLVYGNAVHAALQKWGLAHMKSDICHQQAFLDAFRKYLHEREVLTEKDRDILLHHGEENLPRYYAEVLEGLSPFVHSVEKGISARIPLCHTEPVRPAGGPVEVPIKGLIDRIDLVHPTSTDAIVIDYKTGKPKTEKEIRDGDYFRQLTFYALLMEHANIPLLPKAFILDFIGEGSDEPIQRKFTVSEHDKEELRKIIRAVWQKLQNLDFITL